MIVIVAISIDKNNKKRKGYEQRQDGAAPTKSERVQPKTPQPKMVQPKKPQPQQPKQYRPQPQPVTQMEQEQGKREQKGEILYRSTQNVKEKFDEDILVKEADHHDNCIEGHYEEAEELMKKVEDLMILGPNCNISYERDFVAEGEKMVSSFL